jgi:hypothetical protein
MVIEGHLNLVVDMGQNPLTQYTRDGDSSPVGFPILPILLQETGRLDEMLSKLLPHLGHGLGDLDPIGIGAQV